MRILFVAMPNSIHTARWINMLTELGWEIALFPVYRANTHPELRNITFFSANPLQSRRKASGVRLKRWTSIAFFLDTLRRRIFKQQTRSLQEWALRRVIRTYRPDLIHSIEIQSAGYLTLPVKDAMGRGFPTWWVTNWGSDIFLFGRLTEHRDRIRSVLQSCDYYSCECQRDVQLARAYGFTGKVMPVLPNAGGFELEKIQSLKQSICPSKRRVILLKGYQHWAGRALVGLQALSRCADILKAEHYKVAIYVASYDVKIAAELFEQDTGVTVELIPKVSHDDMLRWYNSARLYLGLSISDAISTSLLEAMAMGAFPIQSCTACADEWIEDGKSGLIVPPEDPEEIANAIRKALLEDDLVDKAAELNRKVVIERLDQSKIQQQVIAMYEDILKNGAKRK